ncbi:endonuclease/exonuclease/phosphatase family protein [Paenibacillus azoreducens]|uniref:Endonuclease/exonuclease/phosphatase domain-containing protein n=1 Tax=Paenibacillus azoreducens TaxID=116718 RepID=A0A919YHC6_9BACL|nr:endonuclease/exonuclease/phosphatase family protein [Paenibacillus azoreducens]GIO49250.1 hypothetical protein J34TS1_40150 [Paenibacillus azoreducens]
MVKLRSGFVAAAAVLWIFAMVVAAHADSLRKGVVQVQERESHNETKKEAGVTEKAGKKNTIRVLTYNIHHGAGMDHVVNLQRIADVIRSTNPDLVALQEVDRYLIRSGMANQAAVLGRLTGMHHEFAKALALEGGEYGIAILSRLPMESVHTIMLPNEAGGEPRVMLTAKLLPGQGLPAFVFANTHLEWQENAELAEKIRNDQAKKIRQYLKGKTPYILAGDMNALPDSKPMHVLTKDAEDATVSIGPTHEEDGKIDYILFDKKSGWKLALTERIQENTASDHYPVFSIFEWSPQGNMTKN